MRDISGDSNEMKSVGAEARGKYTCYNLGSRMAGDDMKRCWRGIGADLQLKDTPGPGHPLDQRNARGPKLARNSIAELEAMPIQTRAHL